MKITTQDKKIFTILDNDSRTSINNIERMTRINKQNIRYRINRFQSSGIIGGYHTTINHRQMGFSIYNILIKISPSSQKEENDFYKFLCMYKSVIYAIKVVGQWNYYISLCVKSNTDVHNFLKSLYKNYSKLIINYDILLSVEDYAFSLNYFYSKQLSHMFYYDNLKETKDIAQLDKQEKKILKLLAIEPLIKISDIIKKTGYSYKTIKTKIKSLHDKNVLIRTRPWVDIYKSNLMRFLIFLRLMPFSETSFKKFVSWSKNDERVVFINKCIGRYDMIIDVNVKDINSFQNLLFSINKNFKGMINRIDAFPVENHLKTSFIFSEIYPEKLEF